LKIIIPSKQSYEVRKIMGKSRGKNRKKKVEKHGKEKKHVKHTKHTKNRSIWKKLKKKIKYNKKKGLILGGVWFLVLVSIMPILENTCTKLIVSIGGIFVLLSFVLGFYDAYLLTMWIDHRISNSDFGIWMRRIIAGVMSIGGASIAVVIPMIFGFGAIMRTQANVSIPYVSFISLSVLFVGFFLGIAVFSGYIEFTHERKAGTIVFFGKTRY